MAHPCMFMSPPDALASASLSTADALRGGENQRPRRSFDGNLPRPRHHRQPRIALRRLLIDHSPVHVSAALVEPTTMSPSLPAPLLLDAQALERLHELDPIGVNKLMVI